jgi:hypothetical protein
VRRFSYLQKREGYIRVIMKVGEQCLYLAQNENPSKAEAKKQLILV